ncbi:MULTISPECIES: restriction endonuclease subunit S [Bacteroidaceae]|jgi:type I restriction enzyme S subunit|uniref:restriction endonuclease subunit S n=1 Tax=Bacteroidaceae TaxID=815 RepID=UPI000519404E|nr:MULTISPECIES: restriction endonuclease subunit S [Bacteroidaceae]MDB0828104.1 restriction endonuclease subunit S [Phocaeicola vulgatus]MDC1679400.1 restriction endonuclease subunit S [Phocaeicola vulgatus]MDC2248018.1 restriction endonuclease subunit S [Bacteroides thetaiotaomicron]MDC2252950.1 restriction endonuclease subunit S [Bacteroides thetaiotaomicron]
MNGKQLKNSILQWAIQGKLVPQDPNDEPTSVLLERIRAEKARLVKEKKIKKDKNESIIYRGDDNSYYEKFLATGEVKCIDEEIPFEIPSSWEWTRIGNIFNHTSGKQQSSSNKNGGTPQKFITTSNLYWGYFVLDNVKVMDFTEEEIKNSSATKGDLLVCEGGAGYGRSAIWNEDYDICLQNHVHRLRPLVDETCEYVYYFIYLQKESNNLASVGTAMPGLSANRLKHLLVPLPPIAEQNRITKKLKEVFPVVEKYNKVQDELNLLNSSLNAIIKKSILQEAIQGKLVPQIAEEGTAQELLEQIQQEKSQLIKEGKLKKSALSDSVIYKGDDNKYYERINGQTVEIELPLEYPNSWILLRLKDVCQLTDGEKRNGKGICLDAKYLRSKSSASIVEKGKFVYAGDNIILVDGENSGEVFPVPQNGYMGSTFKQLWLSSVMWKPYILAFILFYKDELRNSKRGAAIPHLNKELFYNLPIGIPPLAEQQRIACQINNLFQLIK